MTALPEPLRSAFPVIAAMLHARSGLVVGPDKLYLLESRLRPIMTRDGLRGLPELAAALQRPGGDALAQEVVEAMTTNESFFFRDEKPFTHVRRVALPALLAARPPAAPLRIWSAAASTGQEAYSLAMLMAEEARLLGGRRVEIVGTDIAREPLARARAGLYTQFEVQRGLPVQLLLRHFRREDGGFRIAEELRAAVRFQQANLLGDLRGLGQFDIVFLRNVLIYFDRETKQRVLRAVRGQMAPDGFLYLGGAESVLGITETFAPLPDTHGVCMAAEWVRSAA
jgi:chemotaxis protein methyltransferase CheR